MSRKKRVAWNGYMTDEHGVIFCMVVEDQAGYIPMTGKDELAAPWYLAMLDDHRNDDGEVDYKSLWESANETADVYNRRQNYSERDVLNVVASAMREQNIWGTTNVMQESEEE